MKFSTVLEQAFSAAFIILLISIAEIFLPLNNITTIVDHYVYFLSEFSSIKEEKTSCNSKLPLSIKNLGINRANNQEKFLYLQGCEIKNLDQNRNINKTYVLMIDENLYRDYFYSTSALDRCRLKEILNYLIKLKPKILVIDIDLSFMQYGTKKMEKTSFSVKNFLQYSERCQNALYRFIEQTQKKDITQIVMIKNYAFDNIKKNDKVPEGVMIAAPFINTSLGAPLYYNFNIEDVPTVAWAVFKKTSYNDFYSDKLKLENFKISYSKIGFNKIDNMSTENFKDSVIFFGGNYGQDKFMTPLDMVSNSQTPGVLIHGIAYKTLEESSTNPIKLSQFFLKNIDIFQKIILVMIGIIFYRLLKFISQKISILSCLKFNSNKNGDISKQNSGEGKKILYRISRKWLKVFFIELRNFINKSIPATISLIVFTIFSTFLIIIFVLISDFFLFKIKIHYFIVAFFIEFLIDYTGILGKKLKY